MRLSDKLILIKNATANVARGSSAAIVAIVLPPFLTRLMSPDAYGAWALILQVSAYIGYLDFGIQTAVGRFVAYAEEKRETGLRDSIVSTSLVVLMAAGLLGLGGVAVGSVMLPRLFPQMSLSLAIDTRLALVIVGSSLAVGLPASVANGIFVGLQRFEIPALIIGGSKLLGAVCLVIVVQRGGGLVDMAVATALVNLGSYVIQVIACRYIVPWAEISFRSISLSSVYELFQYCKSLTVWSFATLLVTGLDTIIVGRFDFHSVAYYAVAATLITFIVGLQNAIFSVLIPKAAVLGAQGRPGELGNLLASTTRIGMFVLLASGLPLLIVPDAIVKAWIGPVYATNTFMILRVLVIANIIRLSAVPYAMLLIGTGQQKLVIISPLLEGGSNLIASVIAGARMGAIGVALGTLIGAIVGILCNFIYNMPRTKGIAIELSTYFRDGIIRPGFCFAPLIVLLVGKMVFPAVVQSFQAQLMLLAVASSLFTSWIFGLSLDQRSWIITRFRVALSD